MSRLPISDLEVATEDVVSEVVHERVVQRGRFGNPHDDTHSRDTWGTILGAYVGHVHETVRQMGNITPSEEARLRAVDDYGLTLTLRGQLVKVAATAVAWIEAIDRREARNAELEAGRR